jgi:hypothetical protein
MDYKILSNAFIHSQLVLIMNLFPNEHEGENLTLLCLKIIFIIEYCIEGAKVLCFILMKITFKE